jgi:hypothetical protein
MIPFIFSWALMTTYHVGSTGNDGNTGMVDQPFATIAKASSILRPGDECIIHAGTYRETIRPASSGTNALPIIYRAAGDGPVVVSGADLIRSWQISSSGIYEASLGWDLGNWKNQVFVDGQMMVRAQFPNVPYDRIKGFDLLTAPKTKVTIAAGSNTMFVPAATQPNNFWAGATVWNTIWPAWTSDIGTVVSSSPGRLKINKMNIPWAHDSYPEADTGKGYLTGTLKALDAPGEWHIQNGKLSLKTLDSSNPSRHVVEVKRRSLVADLSARNNIRIDGIQFNAGTIKITGNNSIVKNSTFKYVTQAAPVPWWYTGGLEISGSNNRLENCSVDTSSSNGINLGGSHNTIHNCVVRNVNYNGDYSAAVALTGDYNTIERSTLTRSGRMLVLSEGTHDTIRYNDLSVGNLLTADSGLVYTVGFDGKGTKIIYNWLHGDNKQAALLFGIHLDDGSSNYIIHHNIIWNTDDGIHLGGHEKPSTGHRIYNNTIWGNKYGGIAASGSSPLTDVWVYNNLSDDSSWPGTDRQNNFTTATPRFVDAPNHDYRLQRNSPAVDRGRVIKGITDGYQGVLPDVGAYEYGTMWTPGASAVRSTQ